MLNNVFKLSTFRRVSVILPTGVRTCTVSGARHRSSPTKNWNGSINTQNARNSASQLNRLPPQMAEVTCDRMRCSSLVGKAEMPREVQEIAFTKGLIPYITADRG